MALVATVRADPILKVPDGFTPPKRKSGQRPAASAPACPCAYQDERHPHRHHTQTLFAWR